MLDRYRKHEGDDQLDFFPKDKRHPIYGWAAALAVVGFTIGALFAPLFL